MPTKLQKYFPILRNRDEILKEIDANVKLTEKFYSWKEEQRQEFLDICTGARGIKMLYDSFFKEVMNPETVPEPDILGKIRNKDNLNRAYKRVKANKGAPGVDGMTIEEAFQWMKEHNHELTERIRKGHYTPLPVRRVKWWKTE